MSLTNAYDISLYMHVQATQDCPGRMSCLATCPTYTSMLPTTRPSPSLQRGEAMAPLSLTMSLHMQGKATLPLHGPKPRCSSVYLILHMVWPLPVCGHRKAYTHLHSRQCPSVFLSAYLSELQGLATVGVGSQLVCSSLVHMAECLRVWIC